MAYAHVQMVLYRPFIHHIAKRRSDPDFDLRGFACASACINAAMQAVWLAEALEVRGILKSSYWFLVYTTFLAIVSLLMFFLSNTQDPTAQDALAAAQRGFRIMKQVSGSNYTASCCVETLEPMLARFASFVPVDSSVSRGSTNSQPALPAFTTTAVDAGTTFLPPTTAAGYSTTNAAIFSDQPPSSHAPSPTLLPSLTNLQATMAPATNALAVSGTTSATEQDMQAISCAPFQTFQELAEPYLLLDGSDSVAEGLSSSTGASESSLQ